MARKSLPLTPASSVDLQGKDPMPNPDRDIPLALPSPALAPANNNGRATKPQTIRPATDKPNFSLPPPPTRSRKIIQMKPAEQSKIFKTSITQSEPPKASGKKNASSNAEGKKQPSSTSAAGKKMARKTAHSVIERRRRSKMNEEFAVLKDMIPACKDQDMHKLAILSASIEYLRYLEQCVSNLQAANSSITQPPPPTLNTSFSAYQPDNDDEEDDDEDQDMDDAPTEVPLSASAYPRSTSVEASPALSALHKTSSYASSIATLPSPSFGPTQYYSGYTHSTSTSPIIQPSHAQDQDQDHEATAALLMLNQDRRNTKGASPSGRSMSVKDLLSHG